MALTDLIAAANTSTVGPDNGAWSQFISDHLDYIASQSGKFNIPPDMMNLYKYDLKRFLKEQMKRNEDIAWIVCLLNYMNSDFDFDTSGDYIIPTDALITTLYTTYKTISSNS